MRRGFTILELLVASLLLGMLVTILTMIFNQSSIAWRTGVAGVADLDDVRDNLAEIREEADSAYVWNDKVHRILPVWKDDGTARRRAIDADSGSDHEARETAQILKNSSGLNDRSEPKDLTVLAVGTGDQGGAIDTWIVNVKSDGPDREPDTWDDIWSFPDDFE